MNMQLITIFFVVFKYLICCNCMPIYIEQINNSINAEEVIQIPTTFSMGNLQLGNPQIESPAIYYKLVMCEAGTAQHTQAEITIALPNNPAWVTDSASKGFILVQLSSCKDDFSSNCVFAQNYQWDPPVINANSRIVFPLSMLNGAETIYIRAKAANVATKFQLTVNFVSNEDDIYYPYTTQLPFSGSIEFYSAKEMSQYWRGQGLYVVESGDFLYFQISPCQQSSILQEYTITTAITADDSNDYSLFTQGTCPQTMPVEDCTYAGAITYGWSNYLAVPVNMLKMDGGINGKTTAYGVWAAIGGTGAALDGKNTFHFEASINS